MNTQTQGSLYQDSTQPIEARIEDLLGRMTLEEKVAQLGGAMLESVLDNGKISSSRVKALVENLSIGTLHNLQSTLESEARSFL